MDAETLKKANQLNDLIIANSEKISNIKNQMVGLKKSNYGSMTIKGHVMYYQGASFCEKKQEIKVSIETDLILKQFNRDLYKLENLLKKYQLELSKL